MRGTKRLSPFFKLHEVSGVLSFSPGLLLLLFMGKILWVRYGAKTRPACTVAKATDIQWNKMLTVCNTARVKLGRSLTSAVCSNLGPFLLQLKAQKKILTTVELDQGPDMGKCRPGASRKLPPPTVSGVTRVVSQGEGFSEGGLLAIVWACNN